MKTLFIGGIKSGKSRLAEAYILAHTTQKPYYLATTEFIDAEMAKRIAEHQHRRQNAFNQIDEPIKLLDALNNCLGPVLIECISMWLNNMLHHQLPEAQIFQELTDLMQLDMDIVLVQNEVGMGIVPDNPLARHYVDLSGKCAQLLAQQADQVFFCCAGLSCQIK